MSSNPLKFLPLLALAGCGFTPLYGGALGDAASARLDTVAVQNIPERNGQLLRESLQTDLYATGAPVAEHYTLTVSYAVGYNFVGILSDSASTRTRYNATAMWRLSPVGQPGITLAQGTAQAMNAQNIIDQQYFAADIQMGTINQQFADELASNITTQLAAWFRAHPGA